jgi:NADPH:quinone reductase-like Zn-dependent oxidoreductase
MKAARFNSYGGPEVFEIVDLPDPHPAADQVRIEVRASAVTASDTKMRSGALSFGAELPMGTGRDVAGIVDELGEGVTDVAIGDRVFGVADEAAAAEFALVTIRARIPEALGFVDAAAIPAALETATRVLRQFGEIRGRSLLVNGASGGVGGCVVQLAVAGGARVIGVAGQANLDYVRALGAEPVVYGSGMPERVRELAPDGVDLALDIAGNDILADLIALTGDAVNVITVADMEGSKSLGVRFSSGFVDGHAFDSLAQIGDLIDSGQFWLPVDRTFTLRSIADAHRAVEQGHPRGRIVVIP